MKNLLLLALIPVILVACQKDSLQDTEEAEDLIVDVRGVEKIAVCHCTDDETNPYVKITIADPAFEAHEAHGDAQPGEMIPGRFGYQFGPECEVINLCDPQEHATVVLADGKTWLAQNLRIDVSGSSAYPGADPFVYGRLYTWEAAQDGCEALGPCWRVPTKEDWDNMVSFYDDGEGFPTYAGYDALIDGGYSGFDAILAGYERYFPPAFLFINDQGTYWSSTQSASQTDRAWFYYFKDFEEDPFQLWRHEFGIKLDKHSCRCVRD